MRGRLTRTSVGRLVLGVVVLGHDHRRHRRGAADEVVVAGVGDLAAAVLDVVGELDTAAAEDPVDAQLAVEGALAGAVNGSP